MKVKINQKVYLGDSVYARLNPSDDLVLTTENGEDPSNTIILSTDTMAKLVEFLKAEVEDED